MLECGRVRAARITEASSEQVRLSWNKPHEVNGVLVGYMLTYTGMYAVKRRLHV